MKRLWLVVLWATILSATADEMKISPILGCVAAWEETMKAACLYQAQTGHYPKNLAVLQIRHTHCPVSGKEYSYSVSADGRNFFLYCPGKTHRSDGARPNHPWFSLKGGLEVR